MNAAALAAISSLGMAAYCLHRLNPSEVAFVVAQLVYSQGRPGILVGSTNGIR